MRGACDGCLARVNGSPNVMTCLVPATEGAAVVSQIDSARATPICSA